MSQNLTNYSLCNGTQNTSMDTSVIQLMTYYFITFGIPLAIIILAIVANVIIILILRKKGKKCTVFDLTIASLIATDLIICVFVAIYILIQCTTSLIIKLQHPAIGLKKEIHVTEKAAFVLYAAAMFFLLSLIQITSMSFMRLAAVFFPFRYRQVMTKGLIKKLLAVIWILSLGFLPVVYFVQYFPMSAMGTIVFSFGGVLFVVYVMIAIKCFFLVKRNQFQWRQEHRVILNSFGVTVSFFACLSTSAVRAMNSKYFFDTSISTATINMLCDPLLYFYFSYWLAKRDGRRRSRRVDGQENAHAGRTST